MAYKNWDLKPRIYKAYQSGTDLIIEGVHLNRWKTNIASIEFFFETYVATNAVFSGYGYQIMHGTTDTTDTELNPTHTTMGTFNTPSVSVNALGTVMTVSIGFDISNYVQTYTDYFVPTETMTCLLFAKVSWTGLDVTTDGATAYSININAWRSIDTQNTETLYSIRRITRNVFSSGNYGLTKDYSNQLKLPVANSNHKTIMSNIVSNVGIRTRPYLNMNMVSYGYQGQPDGFVFASNATLATTSYIEVRELESLVRVNATSDYIMSLNIAMPVYVLYEDGIEDLLALPLPTITSMMYDRNTNLYHIYGTGLTNRPITLFGWDRQVPTTMPNFQGSSFSHPIINVISSDHITVEMGSFDWLNGGYASLRDTPVLNSLLTMRVAFLSHDPLLRDITFFNSIDGTADATHVGEIDTVPTSSRYGLINPALMYREASYNSATWSSNGWVDFYVTRNALISNYVRFTNLVTGETTAPNSGSLTVTPVTINGLVLDKISVRVPVGSFASATRTTLYHVSLYGLEGVFLVNVLPMPIERPITFDAPFIVLGDNGYYNVSSEIIRGEKATLLVRAVDLVGVTEHPPASPYNNTVRISDAEGGWGQQVTVEVVGDDGIEVYPYTVAFLSEGHNGADYSYEVARFEIRLKNTVNVWKGQLRFSIPTPFILNNLRYSGEGYSIPITLTRQDSYVVPLDVEDPASCMRGSIESNKGHRAVNLRGYVPEYLKESPFENFVGVFEETLNTMYTGASTNDPYITKHSILDKIDGLLDLHDPDNIPSKYLHVLASNLGYDMVTGMLRAKDITNAPIDLVRYARFMVASLPEINRNKATKDSIRGLMFSIGALADIYYKWTTDYGTNYDKDFKLKSSPDTAWTESNENALYEKGTMIETTQITNNEMALTPHFRIDVDLSRLDLYSQTEGIADILARALNTINALRPVNTVLDEMSLVIDVEHDVKQLPTMIQWWGDGFHSITDTPIPPYLAFDAIDEGVSTLSAPFPDSIDELSNTITPLPDSVVSPNGLI